MIKVFKILYLALSLFFFIYLIFPEFEFPKPLPDALQSNEPADTESPLRKAYFTNATRKEVMNHYSGEFKWGLWLNYPPEEAGTIIRDQTRSTFLQEIVHPFRESIYINGYEPKPDDAKNQINIEGKHYRQKITIRLVSSAVVNRLVVYILLQISIVLLFKEYLNVKKY